MDTNLFLAETVEKCPKGIKNCVCVNLRESAVNILLKVILCDLCGSTLLTTLSPSKGVSAVNRLLSESMCLNRQLISYELLILSLILEPREPVPNFHLKLMPKKCAEFCLYRPSRTTRPSGGSGTLSTFPSPNQTKV